VLKRPREGLMLLLSVLCFRLQNDAAPLHADGNAGSIHNPKRLANRRRNLQLAFRANVSVVLLHGSSSDTEIWLKLSRSRKKKSRMRKNLALFSHS
jgi:hypothetical protein